MLFRWIRRPSCPAAAPRRPTFRPGLESLEERAVPYAPNVSLTSSLNPAALGQAVTFTANVDFSTSPYSYGPGYGTLGGTVTFYDNGTPLGTATLNYTAGNLPQQATFTTSQLGAGTNIITARFNGDGQTSFGGTWSPATSGPLTETLPGGVTPPGSNHHHRHFHHPVHPHHPVLPSHP